MTVEPPERVLPIRTPRAGELSARWRLITSVTWILVAVAFGSVWNASDQLGLSTWWLGPRGEPRPRLVQLLPFIAPVMMVLASVNHACRLMWWGSAASVVSIAIGVVDLEYVARLGWIEIAVGIAAGAVSLGSSTGTYRPVADDR